jgi:hypothetical protein
MASSPATTVMTVFLFSLFPIATTGTAYRVFLTMRYGTPWATKTTIEHKLLLETQDDRVSGGPALLYTIRSIGTKGGGDGIERPEA